MIWTQLSKAVSQRPDLPGKQPQQPQRQQKRAAALTVVLERHGHRATQEGIVAVAGVVDGQVLGQLGEAAVQRPRPFDGPGQAALQFLHHAAHTRLLATARPSRLVH